MHVKVEFDYLGIIVGVLAILVTALVGWQIYTAFNFEEKINKKFDKISQEYKKTLTQKTNDMRYFAISFSAILEGLKGGGKPEDSIRFFFKALEAYIRIEEKDALAKNLLKSIEDNITKLNVANIHDLELSEKTATHYVEIAIKSNSDVIKDFAITMLAKIQDKNDHKQH